MSKIGFINDVVRGIKKVVSPEVKETPSVQTQVIENATGNVKALLDRGFMALEDGEWQKADDFFEQVLNFDAKLAEAYLGKLMAELQVENKEDLKNCENPFDDRNNYQKVVRFGNEPLKKELKDYIEFINNRNEDEILKKIYAKALQQMNTATTEKAFKVAATTFSKISEYKDSKESIKKCLELAEEIRIKEEKRKLELRKEYHNAGICQYCGGSFKGLFTKTCVNCGRKKDY